MNRRKPCLEQFHSFVAELFLLPSAAPCAEGLTGNKRSWQTNTSRFVQCGGDGGRMWILLCLWRTSCSAPCRGLEMCLGFRKRSGCLWLCWAHGPDSTFSAFRPRCWSGHQSKNRTGLPGHLLQDKFSRIKSWISQALRSSDCCCRMTPNLKLLGSWSKWVSVFTTKILSC